MPIKQCDSIDYVYNGDLLYYLNGQRGGQREERKEYR